ncbi:MAG: DUF4349 domain-containing protein [Clostridiales bacterium]|nr:DUF4349 domain-containing protein [Clostridiales bacterium]
MMKCEDIKKNLDLYIDHEILSKEEIEAIDAHLAECDDCRLEYDEMKKMIDELSRLSEVELPKDFHDNLMNEIRKSNKINETFFKKHYKWAVGTAAVLLAGIVVTAGIQMAPGLLRGSSQMVAYDERVDYGMEAPSMDSSKSVNLEMTEVSPEAMPEESPMATNVEERKIIKNIYMELDTSDIELTFNNIQNQVNAVGGYVEYSNMGDYYYGYYERTQSQEKMRYASINARVPSNQLESVTAYVESLGELRTKSLNTVDQTDYYYDIDAQIENLKVRETRLRELMDEAKNISDIITIESELSRVRNEIDSLTRNLKSIDKNVDYSTLNISLREVEDSSKINPEDRSIWQEAKDGIIKNINRIINFLQSTVIFAISYLPVAVMGLIGLGAVYWMIKKTGIFKRRMKK